MGTRLGGLRRVLARRIRATSGGESIGGAGPHLQRLGVGADRPRRGDVSRLSLRIFVNFASSPSVTPRASISARSLPRSLAPSLTRSPRFREFRDDFEGQVVAGVCFMQRSTSLRQLLHARRARHAVRLRRLVRQRPVRAEPFAELVTQVLPVFLRHRRPSVPAFPDRPHPERCASHGLSVNRNLEGLLPRRYQRDGVEAKPVEVRRDDAVRARRARRALVVRFAIRVRGHGIRIGRVNRIRRRQDLSSGILSYHRRRGGGVDRHLHLRVIRQVLKNTHLLPGKEHVGDDGTASRRPGPL